MVIPTWNEAGAIGPVVAEVLAQGVGQVIVADGSSQDATREIARKAGATVLDAGRGYGRACHLGAEAADSGHDVIAFMDGDGADRPDQLEALCRPILLGSKDFTIASRTRGVREPGSMNWHQVVAGAMAGRLMGVLYGTRYTDMCALRAIRRDALRGLAMSEMTYGWNIEMQMKAARAGLRIAEFPVPYRVRAAGQSKVAGSLKGTLNAGSKIVSTFVRVATSRAGVSRRASPGRPWATGHLPPPMVDPANSGEGESRRSRVGSTRQASLSGKQCGPFPGLSGRIEPISMQFRRSASPGRGHGPPRRSGWRGSMPRRRRRRASPRERWWRDRC